MTLEEQITEIFGAVSATSDEPVPTEEGVYWLMQATAATMGAVLVLACAIDELRSRQDP